MISKYCEGEKCACGKDSINKLEQVIFDDMPPAHGYTQYVCQDCFDSVMRPYLKKEKEATLIKELRDALERATKLYVVKTYRHIEMENPDYTRFNEIIEKADKVL